MEPVTLIVAALTAGVSAGLGEAASQAVTDAYEGLKTLVKGRFAGDRKAEETFKDFEAEPDIYERPLAKRLKDSGAGADQQILAAAEELLKQAQAAGVSTKYKVTVTGGKVGIIGDHGHIDTMN
jgi:hypothetical protein